MIPVIMMFLLPMGLFALLKIEAHYTNKRIRRRIAKDKIKEFERQQHYEDHNSQSSPGRLTLR